MTHTTSPPTHVPSRTGRIARYSALLAVPLLVGILSACSAGNPETEDTASGQGQTFNEWQVSFSSCMRDEGIADFPDPTADGAMEIRNGDDMDHAAMEQATTACIDKLGQPPAPPGQPQLSDEERHAENLATAKCFRENGVEMDDPKPGQAMGITSDIPDEVLKKCGLSGVSTGNAG